jgi:3-oxoacyl-[acyl-carrier-protein] synthase-3
MDEAIIQRFYKLYKQSKPTNIMPMSIHTLGKYSIATFPKLYDLLIKGELQNRSLEKGDVILFASVGAGMNINVMAYRTK